MTMEYRRKIRWANYQTPKCKEYLRSDFSYECAYCKLQEKELGIIDSSYFEIDHFRPQSDTDEDFNPHLYFNLYYSCQKCNGEKSDKWSENLLDPCRDDIFSGECPPIVEGYNPEFNFKYIAKNKKGELYIDTFKLNSRYNIKIRKRRIHRENNILEIDKLIDEIICKFERKNDINNYEELSVLLDRLRNRKNEEIIDLLKNSDFEDAKEYLNKRNIKNSIILEEYNMDMKIKLSNQSYYCELIVDKTKDDVDIKIKYISTEKLKSWHENIKIPIGILYYYPNLGKMYFYNISDTLFSQKLDNLGKKVQVKIQKDFLLE